MIQAKALSKAKGLSDSRYANSDDAETAEGEEDEDHTSAALASVREPFA